LVAPVKATDPRLTDAFRIARISTRETGQCRERAVVSAGIRKFGTLGAAEFLSDPADGCVRGANAPRDWRKKNMQAVLAIDVKDAVTAARA
jgi:hypothetical protein